MHQTEGKYLLVFASSPRVGSQGLKKALAVFGSPVKLFEASDAKIREKLPPKLADLMIESRRETSLETELAKLQKLNIGYVTIFDSSYPKLLVEIYDCPAVLYVRGNVEILNKPSLAVVGSRKYTNYGAKVARDLSVSVAGAGAVIVSGLALGIDAVAHRAALDAGGLTVGVLGCGLDQIYPVANFNLGQEIIEKGGALISEFPIGTPAFRQNFPIRNRIIAGLSKATLVVEAAEDSGSLITAGLALEYNRDVMAVPGNIDSLSSIGTNNLIKQGAIPVTSPEDILQVLEIETTELSSEASKILPETDEEKKILALLHSGPKSGTELIAESGLNVVALNSTLSGMELKGLIENIGGGRYQIR